MLKKTAGLVKRDIPNDDDDLDDYENLRSEKMVMMTLIFIHRMPR